LPKVLPSAGQEHGKPNSDPPTEASMNWIMFALGVICGACILLYFIEFGRDLDAHMRDAEL